MGWALLGASSLLIGALIAFAVRIGDRLLGFILAFGAGVLISAVAYELVEEAVSVAADRYAIAGGFVAGALVFFAGDVWIEKRLGRREATHGLAIVLGAVLDGIPESVVIGASLLTGDQASVAVIVAERIFWKWFKFLGATPSLTASTSASWIISPPRPRT